MIKPKKKASGTRKPLLAAAATIGDRAASRKQSDSLFIRGSGGRHILSIARLQKIEVELRRGDPLNSVARSDVLQLLDYVWTLHHNDEASRGAGRPKEFTTMDVCAQIVNELHTRHKIKVEAAVSAMVRADVGTEDSRRKLRLSVKRAYQTLKASGENYAVVERDVLEALARINPPQKVK